MGWKRREGAASICRTRDLDLRVSPLSGYGRGSDGVPGYACGRAGQNALASSNQTPREDEEDAMTIFGSLPPSEQARQLANPDGAIGIQVAEWMNENNRMSNAQILALLRVQPGNRVLEIGFGNGRAASEVVAQAEDVHYTGIDISPTMLEEAVRVNSGLVASGRVQFHRASAEQIPFPSEAFDRVLSVAVMHFWIDPLPSLREVHRVMRPGALAVMSAVDPQTRPSFAQPEFGFFLRSASEWSDLAHACGFRAVDTQSVETEQRATDGNVTRRKSLRLLVTR